MTTLSKPGIAQPVLMNGLLVSESNGVKGGAQSSSEQQSALSQSYSKTQSSQSSYSSSMSFKESSQSSYEYRARARITLADCQLDLKASTLTIKPKPSGFEFNLTTLNLDEHVGNVDGELVWGSGAFSKSSDKFHLEGPRLVALCKRTDGTTVTATLDLNEHITYSVARCCFEAILPDPALTELMSSAGWMNVAVIAQPDMHALLTNTAFQESIRRVARRTVEEVVSEFKEEMMCAVMKAVLTVSERSEEHILREMETLTKRALLARSTAYSGLGELTVMSHEQRHAFQSFAPHIGLWEKLGNKLHLTATPVNGHPVNGHPVNGLTAAAPVPEAALKDSPATPKK